MCCLPPHQGWQHYATWRLLSALAVAKNRHKLLFAGFAIFSPFLLPSLKLYAVLFLWLSCTFCSLTLPSLYSSLPDRYQSPFQKFKSVECFQNNFAFPFFHSQIQLEQVHLVETYVEIIELSWKMVTYHFLIRLSYYWSEPKSTLLTTTGLDLNCLKPF